MTTFRGSTNVEAGYYFSMTSWNVQVVPPEGGTLAGPATGKFLRIPFPLLFAVVPFVGLAFLIFLPFIGFALFAYAIVRRVTGHVSEQAGALAATISPDMATGAAYLAGAKGEEKGAEQPAAKPTPELEQLEKEIEAKRAK